MSPMIPIYAALIKKGVKTLDDVPSKLKDAVKQYMQEEEKENEDNS